ncbi:MAG: hypothetical protein ABIG39_01815 [Candidatus Micrarchaeota archaeon]
MKGQDNVGLGYIYLTFFILLVGLGGYWILHSNTWIDYDFLYGPTSSIKGKVLRIEKDCNYPKKSILMIEDGKSQAYVYLSFKFDAVVGDEVGVTAYNVTGRGLIHNLLRSECEPDGFHYYATKATNHRTARTVTGKPWQK